MRAPVCLSVSACLSVRLCFRLRVPHLQHLNQLVHFHEMQQSEHPIEDDLSAIILIPYV
jgi:hypothetical protein